MRTGSRRARSGFSQAISSLNQHGIYLMIWNLRFCWSWCYIELWFEWSYLSGGLDSDSETNIHEQKLKYRSKARVRLLILCFPQHPDLLNNPGLTQHTFLLKYHACSTNFMPSILYKSKSPNILHVKLKYSNPCRIPLATMCSGAQWSWKDGLIVGAVWSEVGGPGLKCSGVKQSSQKSRCEGFWKLDLQKAKPALPMLNLLKISKWWKINLPNDLMALFFSPHQFYLLNQASHINNNNINEIMLVTKHFRCTPLLSPHTEVRVPTTSGNLARLTQPQTNTSTAHFIATN